MGYSADDIETVLANWIREASSRDGVISADAAAERWIARHFLKWWGGQVRESLDLANFYADCLRAEWKRAADSGVIHELEDLTHLEETLADLRGLFDCRIDQHRTDDSIA